jgi:hypothetical protein
MSGRDPGGRRCGRWARVGGRHPSHQARPLKGLRETRQGHPRGDQALRWLSRQPHPSPVRRPPITPNYLTIFRFDTATHLHAWEVSAERREWLNRISGLIVGTPVYQALSGLETCSRSREGGGPIVAPPRYKMLLVTWVAVFPLLTAFNYPSRSGPGARLGRDPSHPEARRRILRLGYRQPPENFPRTSPTPGNFPSAALPEPCRAGIT